MQRHGVQDEIMSAFGQCERVIICHNGGFGEGGAPKIGLAGHNADGFKRPVNLGESFFDLIRDDLVCRCPAKTMVMC